MLEERITAPQYRALTTGSLALISLIAFETLAIATAMPVVAADLDGIQWYGLAFSSIHATGVIGMVVAGSSADRHGPQRPLWVGITWFTVGLVVAGLAVNMPILVLGRTLQGFGAGMLIVSMYVVVGHGYPDSLRPALFAAFAGAWVIPSLIGPALAGMAVERLHWRVVFLAVPALMLPASMLVARGLRHIPAAASPAAVDDPDEQAPPSSSRPPGRLGQAMVAAAAVMLLQLAGQRDAAMAVVFILVGTALILWASRHLLPAGTLRARPGLPSVIALRGIVAGAFVEAEILVPLMLVEHRGWSAGAAGAVLSAGAIGWSFGSWLQKRFPSSPRRLIGSGMGLVALGVSLVSTLVWTDGLVVVGVLGWVSAGLGMGIAFPTLSVLTLRLSPVNEQGVTVSALQLADSLGSATTLAVGGMLLAVLGPTPTVYMVGFGVATFMALAGLSLAGRPGGRGPSTDQQPPTLPRSPVLRQTSRAG